MPERTRRWRWWLAGLAGLAVLGALLTPWVLKAREKPRSGSCLSYEKQLLLLLLQYAEAHDGRLPATEGWLEEPGVRHGIPYTLRCPYRVHGSLDVTYALVPAHFGRRLSDLSAPAQTIILYETANGLPAYPHNRGLYAGYADGHAKWLSQREFERQAGPLAAPTAVHRWSLLDAAARGQLGWLRWHLFLGEGLDDRNEAGRTALHLAALQDNAAVTQLLLDRGAWVSAGDDQRVTALHLAAGAGRNVNVRLLLAARAPVNAVDAEGLTPLLWALRAGQGPAAAELLQAGADPNVRLASGQTPLHLACRDGLGWLVPELLRAGADPRTADPAGVTPLHLAAAADDSASVTALARAGADPNAPDAAGQTSLHYTAKAHANGAAVPALVQAGARLTAHDRAGDTPLLTAVSASSRGAVQALLQAGASPEVRNARGDTALLLAAREGKRDVISPLLDQGASWQARTPDGRTALGLALARHDMTLARVLMQRGARPGPGDLVKLDDSDEDREVGRELWADLLRDAKNKRDGAAVIALLNTGLDPNYQEYQGSETLLSWAIREEQVPLVRELLRRGVPAKPRERYGIEPLAQAAREGNPEIVRLLLARGAPATENALRGAVDGGHAEVARLLLARGAPPQRVLETAARTDHVAVMRLLAQKGGDLRAEVYGGRTLLHLAAEAGRTQMIRYLVSKGLSVKAQDAGKRTPLLLAAENRHLAAMDVLLWECHAPLDLPAAILLGRVVDVKRLIAAEGRLDELRGRYTPVQWALLAERLDLARMMVAQGAKETMESAAALGDTRQALDLAQSRWGYDARGAGGRRPLHWAAYYGHTAIVAALLERPVEVNSRDDRGCTPLRLAEQQGHRDAAALLRAKGGDLVGK